MGWMSRVLIDGVCYTCVKGLFSFPFAPLGRGEVCSVTIPHPPVWMSVNMCESVHEGESQVSVIKHLELDIL